MKDSKDILSSILKTTQMGQIGIRSILNEPLRAGLRTELRSQLREYDAIEQEAHGIARSRGWELKELDPAIKGFKNLNQFPPSDQRVAELAQRLIDIEETNNRQLQGFL